jgi:hypothetical protein
VQAQTGDKVSVKNREMDLLTTCVNAYGDNFAISVNNDKHYYVAQIEHIVKKSIGSEICHCHHAVSNRKPSANIFLFTTTDCAPRVAKIFVNFREQNSKSVTRMIQSRSEGDNSKFN